MVVAAAFGISGCGPVRARPVDVELARTALITVLEQWRNGGTIDELQQQKPAIIAQEPLWTNGKKKLVEYRLVDNGRAEDANWFCEVELSLSTDDNDEVTKKTVTYVVGTDPVLTVFHAIL